MVVVEFMGDSYVSWDSSSTVNVVVVLLLLLRLRSFSSSSVCLTDGGLEVVVVVVVVKAKVRGNCERDVCCNVAMADAISDTWYRRRCACASGRSPARKNK